MEEPEREATAAKRILLTDDDERVLFVLTASLRRMSVPCEVAIAQDGLEAFRLLEATAFDLLITDIRLPGIDGIALTALVRRRALHLPVIWMTAYGCRALREDALNLGVFRCLEKPIEVDEFRQIVQQAISVSPSDSVADPVVRPAGHPRKPRSES